MRTMGCEAERCARGRYEGERLAAERLEELEAESVHKCSHTCSAGRADGCSERCSGRCSVLTGGWGLAGRWSTWSIVLVLIVTPVPVAPGSNPVMSSEMTLMPAAQAGDPVMCNEYETCFPLNQQVNVTDAAMSGDRSRVCSVTTEALQCLKEAREDCDYAGYSNLPESILTGLQERQDNLTAYTTSYCGTNGSAGWAGGSLVAMVMWSQLCAWLYSSS